MAAAILCAIGGSTSALRRRVPESSHGRGDLRVDSTYVAKVCANLVFFRENLVCGRKATSFMRPLASRDNFFGRSLTANCSQKERNFRTGVCRCATTEEIEAEKQLIEEDAIERMEKTLETIKSNFNAIRTGRASPALLDRVEVEYYGSPVILKSIAQISAPDGSTLLVQPFDKASLKSIEKAIAKSDLGLTPSNDGNLIRLSIPQLTAERRKELIKVASKMVEEGKVAIRNIRRDAIKSYEKLEKEKKLSEDNVKDLSDDLQKLTDEYIKKADLMYKQKEKELLTI